MRVQIPKRIDEIADKIKPHMQFDKENWWHLKDDAPDEIVKLYEEYTAWFRQCKEY